MIAAMAGTSNEPNDTNNNNLIHSLFQGKKLWFSRRCPMRRYLEQQASLNGAIIVQQDKDADMIIADHAKKDIPPGSYSFKFVETSIRNGVVEDPEQYRADIPDRAVRPVGSMRTAAKGTKVQFTLEDDRILREIVQPYAEAGGTWKGNKIYYDIAEKHPQHTAQSWRDRFIKRIVDISKIPGMNGDIDEPPPKRRRVEEEEEVIVRNGVRNNADNDEDAVATRKPSSSNTRDPDRVLIAGRKPNGNADISHRNDKEEVTNNDPAHLNRSNSTEERPKDSSAAILVNSKQFTKSDFEELYKAVPWIVAAAKDSALESWEGYATHRAQQDEEAKRPIRTVEAWRNLFEYAVVPEYMRRHNLKSQDELHSHINEVIEKANTTTQDRVPEDTIEVTTEPRLIREKNTEGGEKFDELAELRQGLENDTLLTAAQEQRIREKERALQEQEIELSSASNTDDEDTITLKEACARCKQGQTSKMHILDGKTYCKSCIAAVIASDEVDAITAVKNANLSEHTTEKKSMRDGVQSSPSIAIKSQVPKSVLPSHAMTSPIAKQFNNFRSAKNQFRASSYQRKATVSNSTLPQYDASTVKHSKVPTNVTNAVGVTSVAMGRKMAAETSVFAPIEYRYKPRKRSQPVDHGQRDKPIKPVVSKDKTSNVTQEPPESGQRPRTDLSNTQKSSVVVFETAQERSDRDDSAMFFSAEEDESEPRTNIGPRANDFLDFFEAEEMEPIETHSDHAPSDTGSEYVRFDETPERHQLWESSKDEDEFVYESEESESDISEVMQPSRHHISTPGKLPVISKNQEDNRESAPHSTSKSDEFRANDNEYEIAVEHQQVRLETQAILNQPLDDLNDLSAFDLPEPEGGWDELEIEAESNNVLEIDETPMTNSHRRGKPLESQKEPLSMVEEISDEDKPIVSPTPRARIRYQDDERIRARSNQMKAVALSLFSDSESEQSSYDERQKAYTGNATMGSQTPSEVQSNMDNDSDNGSLTSSDSNSSDDEESQATAHDTWFNKQIKLHTERSNLPISVIHPIISTAYLSSNVNTKLASKAIPFMIETYKAQQQRQNFRAVDELLSDSQARSLVPVNLRGVWTETDDARLVSSNESNIRKVEQKHGDDACELRVKFLRAWNDRQKKRERE